ncbi:MAG TPA: VOC family protein [Acidimicrobiia bacterium]|nr:VOC family protein [Acidimicrobiia bacterium]
MSHEGHPAGGEGTAFTFQVVIDCQDPHVLADWWAETLRWVVEPQDEAFIRSMIDQGRATDADTTQFRGKLVWREGAAIHPDSEPSPGRSRILFQLVPETKTVKNRVHLDIRVGGDDVEAVRDQLVSRGATVLYEGRQGPHTWLTMADPEGNEFCV